MQHDKLPHDAAADERILRRVQRLLHRQPWGRPVAQGNLQDSAQHWWVRSLRGRQSERGTFV